MPTTVYKRVKDIVVDKLNAQEADVQEGTRFVEDLKADSLDLVELIMAFEEEFSTDENRIEIPDGEAAEIKTVADAVNWLQAHGVKDTEAEEVPTR